MGIQWEPNQNPMRSKPKNENLGQEQNGLWPVDHLEEVTWHWKDDKTKDNTWDLHGGQINMGIPKRGSRVLFKNGNVGIPSWRGAATLPTTDCKASAAFGLPHCQTKCWHNICIGGWLQHCPHH